MAATTRGGRGIASTLAGSNLSGVEVEVAYLHPLHSVEDHSCRTNTTKLNLTK